MLTLYTIGHSTRSLGELMEALRAHGIQTLVDVRAFPMSRRLPHFNRESLEASLPEAGIEYRWMAALGGRRKKLREDSPNLALRNPQFRNYADYMLTPEFQRAATELLGIAASRPTAVMCAERVWFHCHRMLISDYVVASGNRVLHIDDAKPPREHKLTADARMKDGVLLYTGDRLF
ncbi:MAG TPA: DUF488 domain-containing protein [Terriglobales bacterium]|nr:DUF488 domain-containing protein [Terriglobales bacterium]